MPVMDGLTATRAIRQMERAAAIAASDNAHQTDHKEIRPAYSTHVPESRRRASLRPDLNHSFLPKEAPSPPASLHEAPALPPYYSKHTPIIGVTASVSEEDRAICLSAGMDGFVQKPIRRDLLMSLLHEWTAGKMVS